MSQEAPVDGGEPFVRLYFARSGLTAQSLVLVLDEELPDDVFPELRDRLVLVPVTMALAVTDAVVCFREGDLEL